METKCVLSPNSSLRAEYANLRAGVRHCAVSSEHRVSTREASTAYAAEDGGVRLKTRPRECWLGMQEHAFRFKSEYGGVRVLSSAGWETRIRVSASIRRRTSAKPTEGVVSPRRRDRDWPRTQKRDAGTERRSSTAGPHLHDPPRPGQPAAASPRHSPATASLSQPAPPSSRATYSVLKWAAKSRSSIQKTPTAG